MSVALFDFLSETPSLISLLLLIAAAFFASGSLMFHVFLSDAQNRRSSTSRGRGNALNQVQIQEVAPVEICAPRVTVASDPV